MILPNYATFRTAFATVGTLDLDHFPLWPLAKVRAGGFSGGFTGIAEQIQAFPITISCNGGANDAVDGVDDFNYYVSQRVDDAAAQYLAVGRADALPHTTSGSITLSLTARAVSELGLAHPTDLVNTDQLIRIVKYVTVYVQRMSDKAIQLVQLLPAAAESF